MNAYPQAESTVQIDDERFRVTLFRIKPGAATAGTATPTTTSSCP